jgi:protein ImuB
MAVVWCPDWPVVAWGVPLDEPVAVLVANRVVATSPAARNEGVTTGQRRRQAQTRCPGLALLDRDLDREMRLFEPVVAALETLTPRIEVTGPGLAGFPTRGPSRFFGGDRPMAERMVAEVGPILARRGVVRVGIADGAFAAHLAARSREAGDGPVVIEPGRSAPFLAGFDIDSLENPTLTGVLRRLGLTTLGAFAALPASDVTGRFGRDGQIAHRLASGLDEHPPNLSRPLPDLAATWQFDPPAERIEGCVFVTKMLADELHATLADQGLACVRVAIEAETETGETQLRLWRHEGALSAAAMADRARWQLDGWLHQARQRLPRRQAEAEPSSGIIRLSLIPDEVIPARGRQLGLWEGIDEKADTVTRAVARLQGMVDPEAVLVPEWRGGLGPAERIALVPAAAVDLTGPRPAASPARVTEPWPDQVPSPAPAWVAVDPRPVELLDGAGRPVEVTGRGELSRPPALLRSAAGEATCSGREVTAWAGPWPADQRWWDPTTHRRRARMQIVLDDGSAHLVTVENRTWSIEASYR